MKKISILFQIIYIVVLTYASLLGVSSLIYILKLNKEVNSVANLNIRNEEINDLINKIENISRRENNFYFLRKNLREIASIVESYLIEERKEFYNPLKKREIILLEKILLKLKDSQKYFSYSNRLDISLHKLEAELMEIKSLLAELKKIHSKILDEKIAMTRKRQKQIFLIDILAIVVGILLFFIMRGVVKNNLVSPLKDVSVQLDNITLGKLSKINRKVEILEIYELINVLNDFIEKRKGDEEYIKELNKKLEEEVQDKTKQLLALIDELKNLQTNISRLERLAVAGELASMVAHELRIPLNSLSLNLELLRRKINKGESENLDDIMNLLLYEIKRIDNILYEFTKAAISKPSIKKNVNLIKIISEVKFLLELDAKAKGVSIQIPKDLSYSIIADEDKIRQVIMNLMLNAIQASPEKGAVKVNVEREKNYLKIKIMDEGEGVSPEILPNLFKPFVTTKEKGTGLGLAISRRIIEEHNGSIQYERYDEGQTVFTIILPFGT